MAGTYPFIDIAVLDGIRERFIRGDALIVVSPDLTSVLWANGPGAAMFGFERIDDALGNDPDFPVQMKRQISALDGSRTGAPRTVSARFASQLIALEVFDIALPDGKPARVLSATGPSEDIETTIQGLGDEDTHVALLDEAGAVIARSAYFERLGILPTTLSDLVIEVRDEDSRMVKRRVRAGTRSVPAGIARLSDAPYQHLLFVIAEGQAEKPSEANAVTTAAEADEAVPEPAEESPSGLVLSDKPQEEDAPALLSGASEEVEVASPEPNETEETAQPDLSSPTPEVISLRDALIREGLLRNAGGSEKEEAETPAPVSPILESVEEPDEEPQEAEEQLEDPAEEPAAAEVTSEAEAEPTQPAAFVFNPDAQAARFVWKVDADTIFTEISPEFAAAVGPQAADVISRRFADVARVFGFDDDGAIAALLEGRDTWSGRTVLWPVEGTSLRVPVDLAALPVYSRERSFMGFRGFGVVRVSETQEDPEAIGLALVAGPATAVDAAVEEQDAQEPAPDVEIVDLGEKLAQKLDVAMPEAEKPDPFQGETPALQLTPSVGRRVHDKIIRLEEHRAPKAESRLTPTERNAFREIADRLRKGGILPSRNEPPVNAVAVEGAREPDAGEKVPPAPPSSEPSGGDLASNPPLFSPERGEVNKASSHSLLAKEKLETSVAPLLLRAQKEEAETVAPPSAVEVREEDQPNEADNDTAIVARLPLPVLIHSADIVHYANQALLDLTGYETLEALADAGGLAALFAEREVDDEGKPGAMMLRRANGEECAVEAHLQAVSWKDGRALMLSLMPKAETQAHEPQKPGDGVSLSADERHALETRIEELTGILDTATDGVVIIGPDGLIRSMNHSAAALFGYEPDQIRGKSFSMLFAIESQRAALDYLDGLSDNGVASVLNDGREVIGREAQGRFIPMFMTIGKLAASNSYCAVLRDITQWKRAEEELTNARREAERASSQKTEFLARISHEIRTPLNAIIGFSELMADEKFGPIGNERYRDYLRDINRSGNHVLALVNDLLDISKIEAGGLDMEFEAVSLNDAIAEAVAIMQPQANRERVIIRSSFPSNLPDIVADARSIKQIALNLLSNAVRFTAPGGQVIVSTSYEANGGVVMRVRDTGIGMTPAEIDQALKPFKQVNATKHNPAEGHMDWRQDGTGLGLPLTKAMVEANRAMFSIESTPGRGTTVEVAFPSTRVLAD
jgi:PAS domain S-box-containing protein